MANKNSHKGWKIAAWALGALLLLIVLLPLALYIPWVQNKAKDLACDYVKRETGLDIQIDRVLIKFPLDVSLDRVVVLDEQRDTMLRAGNLTASIAMRPLLDLQVNVDEARLSDAYYRFISEDSSMVMSARIDRARFKGTAVDLNRNLVNIADGELTGGKVSLDYMPWKKVYEPEDTTETKPWRVNAYRLTLNDVDYTMSMLPTIDRMTTHLARAHLENGKVDTGQQTVDADLLAIDSVDCRYTYYSSKRAADFDSSHPLPVDTFPRPETLPWVVKVDSVALRGSHAVYAVSDAKPASAGLDMNYIEASDINIALNGLYNKGVETNFRLSELTARERSGFSVTGARGGIALNETAIAVDNFTLTTPASTINIDTRADMSLAGNPPVGSLRLTTDSKVALSELTTLYPELATTLKGVPLNRTMTIKGAVDGTPAHMRLDGVNVNLPDVVQARVTGTVDNLLDTKSLSGDLDFDGRLGNVNSLKNSFLDRNTASKVNIPPLALKGRVKFTPATVAGNATLSTAGGSLVGKGEFNANSEGYDIDATLRQFPVSAFMPSLGVGEVTGHIKARGRSFDFGSTATRVDAKVDLASIVYNRSTYRNLQADLALSGGNLRGNVASRGGDADFALNLDGTMRDDRYALDIDGYVNNLDLGALKLYDGECRGSAHVAMTADLDLKHGIYNANASLTDVKWNLDGEDIYSDALTLVVDADNNHVNALFDDEGTHIRFNSNVGVNHIGKSLDKVLAVAKHQYRNHSLDIDSLQQALPKFDMEVKMGSNGLVQRYLAKYDIDFRNVDLSMRNDSNFYAAGKVLSLAYGETVIDTLTINAREWNKYLAFDAHMGNRPGTWDEFAQVDIHGGAKGSALDFLVEQKDIKGEMGYRLGANARLRKSDVVVRLFPHEPIIGYRQWKINDSNYINLDYRNRRILADLNLQSNESRLSLAAAPMPQKPEKDDIKLKIDNLKIEEWTRMVPTLTDMTGTLNADIDLDFDGRNIDGNGEVKLNDFTYNSRREGDLALRTRFSVDPVTASTQVKADVDIDGSTVAIAMGALNDSTVRDPFHLDMKLKRFPLRKANPFIPGNMIRLDGFMTGNLAVTGTIDNPIVNGSLAGDSAFVKMPRYGSTLRMASDSIPVRGNVITLRDYNLYGLNDNPITINGNVDFRNLDNMAADLRLNGRNVQFIGAEQRRFSELFGKGFVDFDGSVKMRGDNLDVRANVDVLAGSNLTYVLQDEISTLTSQVDENMVKFINPNDSTLNPSMITAAKSSTVNILVGINVDDGVKLNVFLDPDGHDRASVEGSGSLKYTLDFAGKDNLTGSYTMTGGEVRYSPPVISQKDFKIEDGSRITFTGEMLNPQLDITGTQNVKASVNSDGQNSRLVDFVLTAYVGGTLKNMDISFNLESTNDMTVANELQAMSPTQRSQTAINLMLYNSYTGMTTGTGGTVNISAEGTLLSFLQSKINNIAQGIKGIDISFGINHYDAMKSGSSTTTTSYSYRLSKSLFNDRFKIVVGGEYSTDVSGEENFSRNLINDISIEYMLNAKGSRYIRLFRHTGFESVLEGQVTQTGVGFVMKHKISSLKSLFTPSRNKKKDQPLDSVPTADDTIPPLSTVPQPVIVEGAKD